MVASDEAIAQLERALAGRYRVLEQFERGGMATVYRAQDLKHPREVAIKVLSPELSKAVDLERFKNEIQLCARLKHPNIVPLFDSGHSDDLVFYIMPFMDGGSLRTRLDREHTLPVDLAVRLAREVASALDYAHSLKRIHRDVKPANILLADGHAQLADFGLARSICDGSARDLTESGVFVGTLHYMSPEQALATDRVDERADVYSLGCVLFEMLTGRPPYEGELYQQVLGQHALAPIPQIRDKRPDVPAHIDVAVTRALAKHPADRFTTAGEFSRALQLPSDAVTPAGVDDDTQPGRARAITHNLPRMYTKFVGRDEQLKAFTKLLRQSPLLTLVGPGGSGKTRLAIELASRTADEFPAAMWFVDLSAIAEGARIPQAVGAVMGVKGTADKSLTDGIVDALGGGRGLLILDNCEHLHDESAELVQTILAAGPRSRVLATSRQALGLAGEVVREIGPLSLPRNSQSWTTAVLAACESVRLFADRAARARPDFELNDENAAAVGAICLRLDGLPLAIELAAARARMLTVDEIASRLEASIRLLSDPSTEHVARHRTLAAALRWSDDLLPEQHSRLLHCLSVFTGGWTLEAATTIVGDSDDEIAMLDALAQLVDRSLVVVVPAEQSLSRYRLLETVRQYAHERLREDGSGDDLQARHASFFLDLAEQAIPELLGSNQVEWLNRLERDHANLLQAARWFSQSSAHANEGLRLAAALSRFWLLHSHFMIGRQVIARALEADTATTDDSHRAAAQAAGGLLALFSGDLEGARATYRDALELSRELGDRATTARILVGYGLVESHLGRHDSARAAYHESLAYYRDSDNARGVAAVLNNLGLLYLDQDKLEEGREQYEMALDAGRRAKSRDAMTIARLNLGLIARRLKDTSAAREHIREALQLAREIGSRAHQAETLELAADLAADLEEPQRAIQLRSTATEIREATGAGRERKENEMHVAALSALRERVGAETFERVVQESGSAQTEVALDDVRAWLLEA